jgi:hypothetical protein
VAGPLSGNSARAALECNSRLALPPGSETRFRSEAARLATHKKSILLLSRAG